MFTPPGKIRNGKFKIVNVREKNLPPLAEGVFVTKGRVKGNVVYGCVSKSGDRSYGSFTFRAKHV